MSALISGCGNYRYWLSRASEVPCEPSRKRVLFMMLNPSTADAEIDDPTIRRCRGFAKSWGCNGMAVINLYAFRATNPKELLQCDDPVGIDNDFWIQKLAQEFGYVVCAWGNNAKQERVDHVLSLLFNVPLMCLGVTKAGMPKHPLYLKSDTQMVEFQNKYNSPDVPQQTVCPDCNGTGVYESYSDDLPCHCLQPELNVRPESEAQDGK